jgi:hypothetical protein
MFYSGGSYPAFSRHLPSSLTHVGAHPRVNIHLLGRSRPLPLFNTSVPPSRSLSPSVVPFMPKMRLKFERWFTSLLLSVSGLCGNDVSTLMANLPLAHVNKRFGL